MGTRTPQVRERVRLTDGAVGAVGQIISRESGTTRTVRYVIRLTNGTTRRVRLDQISGKAS
ncbi:hypothetical protein [Promicromonospora sp. NPDC090134]|uniref:hypothetical protein n=1 Tax=Promicromonospora sp. NPDC090134 TaxID=3364408 RepID=UPI003814559B